MNYLVADLITGEMMHKKPLLLSVLTLAACAKIMPVEEAQVGSWPYCYNSFDAHVLALSGEGTDCGFLALDASASRKAEIRDCLSRQVQEGLPFRTGYQGYGDDSSFCDVAIRDEHGVYWSFYYDSDISGGREKKAAIWVAECSGIELKPGTIDRNSFFSLLGCKERNDIVSKLLNSKRK